MKTDSVSKINLACGNEILKGYLNVDNCSMGDCHPDLVMDLNNFETIPDTIDEVRLSHYIMYVRPNELRPLLRRWYGWLKKGGRIVIEAPNIKKVCEAVLDPDEDKVNKWGLINLYGNDGSPPHRWGWYPESLIFELYEAGFKETALGRGEKKPDRDFKVIAIK